MFASYMETVSPGAEFSEQTDGGTKSAPESRVEPNLRRVKLNIGHLINLWFHVGNYQLSGGIESQKYHTKRAETPTQSTRTRAREA